MRLFCFTAVSLLFTPYCLANSIWGCDCIENCRPKIKIWKLEPPHGNFPIDPETSWINQEIMAFENTTAVFECSSKTPIRWTVTSHRQGSIKVQQKRTFKNLTDENTFCYSSIVTIESMSEDHIGLYRCEDLTALESSILLFMDDKENVKEPYYLNAGSTLKINSQKYNLVFPCSVSHPSEKFYLQSRNSWRKPKVEATFIPHIGFIVENAEEKSIEGEFRCVLENWEKTDGYFVDIQVLPFEDFYVFPKDSIIYAKENLTVKCSSTDPVIMELDQERNLKDNEIVYKTDPTNIHRFTAMLTINLMEDTLAEGKIRCLRQNKKIIKEWAYKRVDQRHGITYDVEHNSVFCQSDVPNKPPSVSVQFCGTPEECDLHKKRISLNNTETVIAENIVVTYSCGENCIQITPERKIMRGGYLINCVIDGISWMDTFFIDLEYKIRTDTENTTELIKFSTNKPLNEVESGESFIAKCKWIPYIFAENAFWVLTSKNGKINVIGKEYVKIFEKNGAMKSILNYAPELGDFESISCYVGLRSNSSWASLSESIPIRSKDIEMYVYSGLALLLATVAQAIYAGVSKAAQTYFQKLLKRFEKKIKKPSSNGNNQTPTRQNSNEVDGYENSGPSTSGALLTPKLEREDSETNKPEKEDYTRNAKFDKYAKAKQQKTKDDEYEISGDEEGETTEEENNEPNTNNTSLDVSQYGQPGQGILATRNENTQNTNTILANIRKEYKKLPILLVREHQDQFALVMLLAIGMLTDILCKQDWQDWEATFFKLAVSTILLVTQTDHFFITREIHTLCGLILATTQIWEAVYKEYKREAVHLSYEFGAIYVIAAMVASSDMFSNGTTIVYFFYLSCNLWLSNNKLLIFSLLIAALWQRRKTFMVPKSLQPYAKTNTGFWIGSVIVIGIGLVYQYCPKHLRKLIF